MKVILLSGKSNCGKTTTLNLVYDKIKKDDSFSIIEEKPELEKSPDDFECLIKYKGKEVAFFTMGDYPDDIVEAFERYELGCDILICACSEKLKKEQNNPYDKIKAYSHRIIEKREGKSEREFEEKNNTDVEEIIRVLNEEINKI